MFTVYLSWRQAGGYSEVMEHCIVKVVHSNTATRVCGNMAISFLIRYTCSLPLCIDSKYYNCLLSAGDCTILMAKPVERLLSLAVLLVTTKPTSIVS